MLPPRRRVLLVALCLFVAACESTGQPNDTDQPGASEPTGSTTPTDSGEARLLEYGFEAGEVYTYDLALEQHIVLQSEGTADAIGEEGVPASADVTVTATGTFTFEFAAGPEDGTYSVTVTGSFPDSTVEGKVDGEPVDDAADIDELGVIQPVSTVVVVDSRGRILDDSTSPSDALGLGATPLAGLSGDLGRMVGPVLPAEPVAVGDTWTETTTDTVLGDAPVDTVMEATLTGKETLDGADTLVIGTTSTTGQAEIDLADFFAEFMGAFADPDDPEAQARLEEAIDQLVFRITIAPSSSESTTWFDAEQGVAVRSTTSGPPTTFRMEVAMPDEETGELQNYSMLLDVTQTLDYTLVPS
jgi:hypothetical protein